MAKRMIVMMMMMIMMIVHDDSADVKHAEDLAEKIGVVSMEQGAAVVVMAMTYITMIMTVDDGSGQEVTREKIETMEAKRKDHAQATLARHP